MPRIIISDSLNPQGTQYQANVYSNLAQDSNGTLTPVPIPGNAAILNVRPGFCQYKNRLYIVGIFSRPMIINEYGQSYNAGIYAPQNAPTLALGVSTGGLIGSAFGYLTFVHKYGNVVLQESNPSAPSNVLNGNGEGRVWSAIPATAIDSRVTHVRGYLALAGSLAAQLWERNIGVTSVTENNTVFGNSLPVLPASTTTGTILPDLHTRGVPPYSRFVEAYHEAVFYAGSGDFPNRIWFSKLFEGESVNVIDSYGYLETIDGEPVSGLRRWQDQLIVGTPGGFYAITGYSANDYSIQRINGYFNCIAGHTMIRVGPNSDLWFLSQEGPCMYNGGFQFLGRKISNWFRDNYALNRAGFENAIAVDDRYYRGYKVLIPNFPGISGSFYLYGHYDPVSRGLQPYWVFDQRARVDSTVAPIRSASSLFSDTIATGSCDGITRLENNPNDAGDDGDAFNKTYDITLKHFFYGDQGGDDDHGQKIDYLDLYLKSENQAATLGVYGGDDAAATAGAPQKSVVLPATAATDPTTGNPKVAQTSRRLGDELRGATGKGHTIRLTIPGPLGVEFRGLTIHHSEGSQDRPST